VRNGKPDGSRDAARPHFRKVMSKTVEANKSTSKTKNCGNIAAAGFLHPFVIRISVR
jgi:hypothetical protein